MNDAAGQATPPSTPVPGAAWARRAARLAPAEAPPPHYYAENLLAVVAGVHERYVDMLTAPERGFGDAVAGLSAPALRLLARIIGRRPVLRADRLRYAEVPDVPAALAELNAAHLVEHCPTLPLAELLPLFTVAELRACFVELANPRLAKVALTVRIAATVPAAFCRWRLRRRGGWLRLAQTENLRLYRLLFFGHRDADLTAFVLRDLGRHRFEPVPLTRQHRQFPDRATLQRYLDLLAAADAITALGPKPAPSACQTEALALLETLWQPEANRLLERRRSRALNRLGRALERSGEFDAALACYRRSSLAPARERRMRVLVRLGDESGAALLRQTIRAAPWTALEADFARRFGRPAKRPVLPQTTLRLPTIAVGVERAALAHLTTAGGTGWHLENHLPMAIFALAYWEWVFAPLPGAFVNAFQTAPTDLNWPDFFAARRERCQDPLALPLKPQLQARIDAKAGVANGLFDWRRCPPAVIRKIVAAMPARDLKALLQIIRGDLAGRRAGFPDLCIVHGPGEYEFVEVKGPGDQLQIHQRLWIEALVAHGLPVRVARVQIGSP